MVSYEQTAILGIAAACFVDRFILGRRKIDLISIGEPKAAMDNAIAFPVCLKAKRNSVTGAQIEYWLRDKRDPTTVISGKARTLEFTEKGESRENLLIDTRYLDASIWSLTVRITHGNSRINPLYRLFPIRKILNREFIIYKRDGVFHAAAK